MREHSYMGSVKEHVKEDHSKELTLEDLLNNTEILKIGYNKQTLLLTEALFITITRPKINIQTNTFPNILKIF